MHRNHIIRKAVSVRTAVMLCALALVAVGGAQAQDLSTGNSSALAPSPSSPWVATTSLAAWATSAAPAAGSGASATAGDSAKAWQASFGYAFLGFDLGSGGFVRNYNGIGGSVARYVDNDGWWGMEGYANYTFGSIAADINRSDGAHAINNEAASVPARRAVFGGGPRFAYRKRKVEPWAHVIFAGDWIQFAQVNVTVTGGEVVPVRGYTGFALLAGGGVDYKLGKRYAIRAGADLMSTRLREAWYECVIASGGLVVSF
jgi:hypothetical protein